jgi:hypothetical protein
MSHQERFGDPAEIRHVIGATGSFSLHNVSGDVEIVANDTDEVRVLASSSGSGQDFLPLVVQRSDGGLHIQLEQGRGLLGTRNPRSVDFEVSVPRAARISVNGVSSDIDARGLGGEQSYRTVSGDLAVTGHGGRVSLTSVSGDVELVADEPIAIDLTTTSGDVDIDAPMITDLHIKTVSGDTEIRAGFESGPLHSVESVSGDLQVTSLNGLTVELKRGLDMTGSGGRQLVFGDGSARLRFRSLSGDAGLSGARSTKVRPGAMPPEPPEPPQPPLPPRLPESREAAEDASASLEILQALERGEIDVEEATRRLEGMVNRG